MGVGRYAKYTRSHLYITYVSRISFAFFRVGDGVVRVGGHLGGLTLFPAGSVFLLWQVRSHPPRDLFLELPDFVCTVCTPARPPARSPRSPVAAWVCSSWVMGDLLCIGKRGMKSRLSFALLLGDLV